MKIRSRKVTKKTSEKTPIGPGEVEVVGISNKLPLEKAGKLLQDTLNRAILGKQVVERQDWHPGGPLLIIYPKLTPEEGEEKQGVSRVALAIPGLLAMLSTLASPGSPESQGSPEVDKWHYFLGTVLNGAQASGLKDLKKGINYAVKTLIKAHNFSSEAIREYADLCEKMGAEHDNNCHNPKCQLGEVSSISVEVLRTYLKENLQ